MAAWQRKICHTTPVGFELTRGDPIGLAGRRLNRSAKVSMAVMCQQLFALGGGLPCLRHGQLNYP